jgi:hypothetical protein
MAATMLRRCNKIMRNYSPLSHDDTRTIVRSAIVKASEDMTDDAFGKTIDASGSAVTSWRNRRAEMGSYFLINAMKRHPSFLAELLWRLGYKPVALTEAELDDREFTVALATLQLKHAQALIDGRVDHTELLEMDDELDAVGDGVEKRRAVIRRLRVDTDVRECANA